MHVCMHLMGEEAINLRKEGTQNKMEGEDLGGSGGKKGKGESNNYILNKFYKKIENCSEVYSDLSSF